MTAEERALTWVLEHLGPLYPDESWQRTLASAIRAAESAAREAALEEAARLIEDAEPSQHADAPRFTVGRAILARRIRSLLRPKDTNAAQGDGG